MKNKTNKNDFPTVLRDCVLVEAIPFNKVSKEDKKKIIRVDTNSVSNKMYCGNVIQVGDGIVGDKQMKISVEVGDFVLYPASVGIPIYHYEDEITKEYRILQFGSIIAKTESEEGFHNWSEHF